MKLLVLVLNPLGLNTINKLGEEGEVEQNLKTKRRHLCHFSLQSELNLTQLTHLKTIQYCFK